MVTDDQIFLKKLPLSNLLGLTNVDPNKSAEITAKFWEHLVENFLKNILPQVVSEEEFKALSESDQKSPEFDTLFGQLVDKYPNLQQQFEASFVQYKSLIIKERLDILRRENLLDDEEYAEAKELADKESWQNLYENVLALKDSAGMVFAPS